MPPPPPPDDPAPLTVRRRAAVDWLYGRINYEARTPIPYSDEGMKLDRMRELARRLGNPHDRLRIVHVAGTKGKGSTGAMIAAALEAAGLTAGVFSSPHFDRIEERFAVGGEPCSAAELVGLIDRLRPIAEAMDDEPGGRGGPTFFDLTTAMALTHFADRRVDAAVLEVGLGGRLDSTNVVTPAVSVITSISLDHTAQLGETIEAIAEEKAGVIKPGVPVVSGVVAAGPAAVIERLAAERDGPLWRRDRDFFIERCDDAWRFTRRTSSSGELEAIDRVEPSLPGTRQAENAAVALATLGLLADQGAPLPIETRRRGVASGRLPGRLERFEGDPVVIVDGAHNDASAEALAETLDTLRQPAPPERSVLVVAISEDKDARAILGPLVGRFGRVVATRYVDNPRAMEPEGLATLVRELASDKIACETAGNPAAAYALARRRAGTGGAVVFTGSLLFAAEARRLVIAGRTPQR